MCSMVVIYVCWVCWQGALLLLKPHLLLVPAVQKKMKPFVLLVQERQITLKMANNPHYVLYIMQNSENITLVVKNVSFVHKSHFHFTAYFWIPVLKIRLSSDAFKGQATGTQFVELIEIFRIDLLKDIYWAYKIFDTCKRTACLDSVK